MTHKLIAFFTKILLPVFIVSTLSLPNRCSAHASTETERTLTIIKPDGVSGNYTNSIKETILDHGFKITEELFIQLDEDRMKSFYAEHSSRSFFPSLVEYMAREVVDEWLTTGLRDIGKGSNECVILEKTRDMEKVLSYWGTLAIFPRLVFQAVAVSRFSNGQRHASGTV